MLMELQFLDSSEGQMVATEDDPLTDLRLSAIQLEGSYELMRSAPSLPVEVTV